MEKLILFVAEHTIVNIVPILVVMGVVALLFGKFLTNASNWARIAVYSFSGLVGGLAAYARMTIPERPMELMEGLSLSV